MNIYYIKQVDELWGGEEVVDNKFYAFRTHAQARADELNAAHLEKYSADNERHRQEWEKKKAVVDQILESTGIDITPLLPNYQVEFKPYWSNFEPEFIVVEAEVS